MSSRKQPKRKRNGEGTIYQLSKTNQWRAQYVVYDKVSRRRKRKTITGKSYDEVKAKLDKVKVEIREQTYIEKDDITVGEILEQNLRNQECSNKVSPSTILRNRETANVIFKSKLSKMSVQEVRRQDLQNFLNNVAKRYSNSYIDKIFIQLKNIMSVAVEDEIIRKDPFNNKSVKKPKSIKADRVVSPLTRDEQKAFIEQLEKKDYKYKDIFYVLLETGMRVRRSISFAKEQYRF